MYCKIKNLIEYYGLADELPILDNPSSFKQFCLHESLVLSEEKPDMLKMVKVVSELGVLDKRVIRTPKAISLEGQKLTGFKLIVDGIINQKIEYVGGSDNQALYVEHFNIPFCTYIILPEGFKPGTTMNVTGYLEDISADVLYKRNIFINAALLMVADF